jgi:hypothetical protein
MLGYKGILFTDMSLSYYVQFLTGYKVSPDFFTIKQIGIFEIFEVYNILYEYTYKTRIY